MYMFYSPINSFIVHIFTKHLLYAVPHTRNMWGDKIDMEFII